MTEHEMNIAIAEACGWHDCGVSDGVPCGLRSGTTSLDGRYEAIPGYCNDLNVMRDIVMELNSGENDRKGLAVAFCKALEEVQEEDCCCWIECAVPSARQLARAYLKMGYGKND